MGEAIQKLSPRHVDILNFLIANPTVKLGDVANSFGMTAGWLSQVIHSDAFQRLLSERQDLVFHHTVLPIKEKMTAIAHKALDKLDVVLDSEVDTGEVREAAEAMLDRIGFSAKVPATQVNNNVNTLILVERERLAKARSLIGTRGTPVLLQGQAHEIQADTPALLGSSEGQATLPSLIGENSRAKTGTEV